MIIIRLARCCHGLPVHSESKIWPEGKVGMDLPLFPLFPSRHSRTVHGYVAPIRLVERA